MRSLVELIVGPSPTEKVEKVLRLRRVEEGVVAEGVHLRRRLRLRLQGRAGATASGRGGRAAVPLAVRGLVQPVVRR